MNYEHIIFLLFVLVVGSFAGAYLHELDIQRACNQDHRTGNTTWINELYCVPVDNLGNRFD